MNRRQAKKIAGSHAASWLESLVGAGWPYDMQNDEDPPESEQDLKRLEAAMEEIIQSCFARGHD